MKFAIQHKNPVRRSALTYCENRCPSRIDFGKQRYGGPFTTEEVEDVKVLFNMLKVLLSLSPMGSMCHKNNFTSSNRATSWLFC